MIGASVLNRVSFSLSTVIMESVDRTKAKATPRLNVTRRSDVAMLRSKNLMARPFISDCSRTEEEDS